MSDIIITIYDPSNNIIKPLLKRQPKFYIPKEKLKETHIYAYETIGNDITDNMDFQFINKELKSKFNKKQ
jgi:hypothetical protein